MAFYDWCNRKTGKEIREIAEIRINSKRVEFKNQGFVLFKYFNMPKPTKEQRNHRNAEE